MTINPHDIDPSRQREFAVEVVRKLQAAGYCALWAGGCVRDLLLGLAPADYDVATNARPEQVQALFGPRRTLAIGAAFGVILVQGPRGGQAGDVEVATFRTEGPYLDGRRPENVVFCTPEEDAHRRDFTINGMFFDPLAEEVLDYVGGKDDIARKVVRAIGDPHARFSEDKLRMLRAVRITARFNFALDPVTADAVRQMAAELPVVSQERIAQELKKMLVHPRRRQAVELARDLNLLSIILPELAPVIASAAESNPSSPWKVTLTALEILVAPRFELAFAALLYELGLSEPTDAVAVRVEKICRRLRLSNDECHAIEWLVTNSQSLTGAKAWPLHRLKRMLAEPFFDDLSNLVRAAQSARHQSLADVDYCDDFRRRTPAEVINPPPLVNGDDFRRIGLSPGPRFKAWLDQIRDAQLDGQIATRDEALELAMKLSHEA